MVSVGRKTQQFLIFLRFVIIAKYINLTNLFQMTSNYNGMLRSKLKFYALRFIC